VIRAAFTSILGVGLAITLPSPQEQTSAALAQLTPYLNAIGDAQLARRGQAIAALRTRADAERRQVDVRKAILALVGGLPDISGPVKVKRFVTVEDDGFSIENVAYESAPGYWVAANVYVPAGTGPFPAMVIVPGHGPGKAWQYSWGAAFARAGIVTLSIDAMGQGERLQHVDPATGKSKIEPLGEHEHANQTALLIGQHVARYWFADGIRGVDYLVARGDVRQDRIGTFGCSGGGTAAAYLAAMDPRISVAAVSSFITSFHELMPGNGPQDAEQTLPRFLASGLDFADWVELVTPRPLAIVAFEQDFFPVAGAAATYDEAKRFYSLYGTGDDLRFIRGGGGHCNLGPVMPDVMSFLVQHLNGPGAAVPVVERRQPKSADALTVTPTGQVSTSLGSISIEDLTRTYARTLAVTPEPAGSKGALARLRERLRHDVRQLAGVVATPGDVPRVTTTPLNTLDGYHLDAVRLESEPGITLDGIVAIPSASGRHPAVIWMDASPLEATAGAAEFSRLAASGHVVLAFHPRGVLGEPPPHPEQLALGQYMPVLLRAIAVGKTLVGMRVDDTIRAVSWLASRGDVDPSSVAVRGTGALGLVALHAAALDDRITSVALAKTLVSYRMALEAELHRNLSESLIPGVLTRYDVGDLIATIAPRPVVVEDPVDALGQPVKP
jgi:cephalosporin-C deacetylase-like acetyl esterase